MIYSLTDEEVILDPWVWIWLHNCQVDNIVEYLFFNRLVVINFYS